MRLNKFKGIVFDLDGVLVDTEYYQWQGWVEILKKYGLTISKEEYYDYAGKNVTIIAEELINKFNLKPKKSLSEEKEELILRWFKSKPINLMHFSKESMKYFKELGLKIAICSSGNKEEILIKLNRTGINNMVDFITSRNDVNRGKPFPDIYLHSAKQLNTKPSECLAFEDTQYGLQSAKDAGLYCIAIPNEFSIKQDFSRADKVFNNLEQAVNWLKG
ncbi:MAG: HAD family phosphatase [Candidatus Aenigmarchaeota archaeon]|nr:HAD family phosphatase [Candidatus Aenigmarchaeota archaeon]